MYIDKLEVIKFRNFEHSEMEFVYPGKKLSNEVKFDNINVIYTFLCINLLF